MPFGCPGARAQNALRECWHSLQPIYKKYINQDNMTGN